MVFVTMIAVGCGSSIPVIPDPDGSSLEVTRPVNQVYDERYRLWGEWTLYFPASHDRVDVIPRRDAGVHLNVLKWLEEDCSDCLEILSVHNNGDSTIDMVVQIRHPKPDKPEFTGFDVKGIVMFNGSYVLPPGLEYFPPYPEPYRISWSEVGDPEVLNPDGYTVRWSPTYNSGSDLPLLNYWAGKYSNGTPTANVNAYLEFYTNPERHIFNVYGTKTRTYTIYLPPGPVAAGYAIEACWMPPDNYPVTNPVTDFPISANQDEPYFINLVVNNGEPITVDDYCCGCDFDYPCGDLHLESTQWGPQDDTEIVNVCWTYQPEPLLDGMMHGIYECPNPNEDWFRLSCTTFSHPIEDTYPDGKYRGLANVYAENYGPPPDYEIIRSRIGYTIWDFSVDKD